MAELLFFARDRSKPWDAELDAQAYKRGDVVEIVPDGWNWSVRELTNPDWRILRLPAITDLADLAPLLEEERAGTKTLERDTVGRLLRKRKNAIDLPRLPPVVLAWLNDDTRATPIFTANVSRAAILSLIAGKNPRLFGPLKA